MTKKKKIKFGIIVLLILFKIPSLAQEAKQSAFEFSYNYQIPIVFSSTCATYGIQFSCRNKLFF